jgi:hypothetical protein
MERPKSMQALIAALDAAGWLHAEAEGQDSYGDTFVTLEGLSPDRERKVRVTWHSRRPGIRQPVGTTLRLFSAMVFKPYRGWVDTTLKGLTAAITVDGAR